MFNFEENDIYSLYINLFLYCNDLYELNENDKKLFEIIKTRKNFYSYVFLNLVLGFRKNNNMKKDEINKIESDLKGINLNKMMDLKSRVDLSEILHKQLDDDKIKKFFYKHLDDNTEFVILDDIYYHYIFFRFKYDFENKCKIKDRKSHEFDYGILYYSKLERTLEFFETQKESIFGFQKFKFVNNDKSLKEYLNQINKD